MVAPMTLPRTNRSPNHTFKPERPPKVKRWSHQQDLEAAKGKQVTLLFPERHGSGHHFSTAGTLIEADQFTIKLTSADGDRVFFKSALAGFKVHG